MRSHADDLAAVENEDLFGVADRADALGDDDLRHIMQLPVQTLAQLRVRPVIERRERIVKDQNFRLSRQRAGDGKALLLPAGHVAAELLDLVVRALRQLIHKLLCLRKRNGALKVFAVASGSALAEEYVVAHRSREENGLLRDIAELIVERIEGIVLHVHAVDEHRALRRVVKAGDELDERCLAAAGRADDRERFAAVYLEINVRQRVSGGVGVAERNVSELHRSGLRAGLDAALADGGFAVEHLVDALRGHLRLRQQHEDHGEHHERHDDIRRIRAEYEHFAEHGKARGHVRYGNAVHERGADPVDRKRQTVHSERHRRLHQRKELLVFHLEIHHAAAGTVKLFVLELLRVEGVYHVDAGQIFARHAVDLIRHFLHKTETGNARAHNEQYRCEQHDDERRGHGGELPALAEDLDDRPHRHDGGLDHHLEAHGDDHLNLGDVVRRAGDKARNGKVLHFLAADVHHMAEELFAHRKAESRRGFCGEKAARDRKHRACRRAAEHFETDGGNVRRCAGRFDQHRELRHIVRQTKIKIDLHHDEHQTEQRHLLFLPAHILY